VEDDLAGRLQHLEGEIGVDPRRGGDQSAVQAAPSLTMAGDGIDRDHHRHEAAPEEDEQDAGGHVDDEGTESQDQRGQRRDPPEAQSHRG
jgi:hypothetical protein